LGALGLGRSSGERADRPPRSRRPSVAPFEFGGQAIAPGRKVRCDLPIAPLPTQTLITLPVTIAHGANPGPCIWLSAAIHGDEINGMEIVRQVLDRLQPQRLRGTVIAVPIVNVFGFIDRSRYLPDRRDLNRSFPGSKRGSMAARLAHLFATRIMARCSHGIDFHTASDHRENLPHLRANLDDPETRRIMTAFGAPVAIHAATRDGSLRQAAVQRGICVLVYEAGEALRFNPEAIHIGTEGTLRVLGSLGMISNPPPGADPQPQEFRTTRWIRASRSGILRSAIALGSTVTQGQVIAEIADAFGQRRVKVKAPCTGLMIGVRQNPLVNQGDGIFHLAPAAAP
jgi:predicted deacylase